jgi:hypothetical protein
MGFFLSLRLVFSGSTSADLCPTREDSVMLNIFGSTTPDKLQLQIERLIGHFDPSIPPAFTQAVKALLTAMDFHDPALMRSGLEEVLAALRDLTCETIQKRLGWPRAAREACRSILDLLKGHPGDEFDGVGKGIGSNFDQMLKILTDLRDGPVKLLQDRGFDVENADQLGQVIEELTGLKKDMLENWPWSNRELPAVDRGMVARSRAAIVHGEGEPIEDLIRRLGGNPNNKGT